ncbi:MAG: ABC transporter permease [Chitinophagaceae bacterium]|nr:ABC transporter permease [Chitinophagaceae bacterium]
MIKNYFKTAWRNIIKNKTFSFINIIGLAVSMSVCFLIILIIADQKSYDRFHVNKDRIYRIETVGKNGNEMRVASSALPLADVLRRNYTGIEASAALVKKIGGDIVYNDKIASGGGYFTDGNLFKVMDFKLKQGNAQTALENPFSLVISEELASQLFSNDNAIGKTIKFNDTGINPGGPETGNRETTYGQFIITGVLAPNPGKTILPFKLLASLSTLNSLTKDSILNSPPNDWSNVWNNHTYVLMQKGKTQADLQNVLDKVSDKQYPKGAGDQFAFKARKITDVAGELISNNTSFTVPILMLTVLSILCLVVMLSACLNYTNLSVARLLTRAKEVGVRKVAGATRKQIFAQFITEAVMVSLVSLVFSLLILLFLQKLFSGLWLNKIFNITFTYSPDLYLIFTGFSIAVGFIAGLLPAIYISLFKPVDIFKSLSSIKLFKRLTLRKVLLVTQFCVSLIFIITTSLIYLQGKHTLNFDYGFNKDNVVNITLFKTENYDRFAQAVSSDKNIVAISACSFLPATGSEQTSMIHKAENHKDSINANYLDIDAGCMNVWGLQLIAGKNLPEIPIEKNDHYVLMSEKMVHDFKYASVKEAVGQHIVLDGNDAEIIGVVKDFHFTDVTQQDKPLILRNRKEGFGYVTIRISSNNIPATLDFLKDTWKKVNPSTKFEYQFFDQQLLVTHSILGDMASVISLLSFLAVLISCMGLLGMATYTAKTRQKEIGIRKVLGSSVGQVIVLLSKSYLILLAIAVVIAVPIAFIVNNMWLQAFASRVSISPLVLFANIAVLIIISLIIVLSQAWKVSVANPVKSLRTE